MAQWLEQTFSGEDVPEFELTDTTVSHLHQMAVASQRNDRNLQLCVDDLQHKCDEYNAEGILVVKWYNYMILLHCLLNISNMRFYDVIQWDLA